jgi:hypothetical protein
LWEEVTLDLGYDADYIHHLVYFANYTLMSRGRQGIVLLLHYSDEVSQQRGNF